MACALMGNKPSERNRMKDIMTLNLAVTLYISVAYFIDIVSKTNIGTEIRLNCQIFKADCSADCSVVGRL